MAQGGNRSDRGASGAAVTGRILLAEDDGSLCRVLVRVLAKAGYAVDAVLSGDEARDRVATQEYDVILCDINMPGMKGPEILQECRKRWPHTEVVLMTGFGYNPNHTLVKVNKNLRYPCLFKPFDRARVAATVQQAWQAYHGLTADKGGAEPALS